MSRHGARWSITLAVFILLLHAAAPPAAGQVRAAPGGVRPPGTTTAPREAPLLNWADVTASEFSTGGEPYGSWKPFFTYSLEPVEGSPRWVRRHYHWDASGLPVVDDTSVLPNGARVVQAVTGYYHPLGGGGGWYGYPDVAVALLVPITSAPMGARPGARVGPAVQRADPKTLSRIPAAQALGYQRVRSVPSAQSGLPATCPRSTQYPSQGPPLQASCVLLEPGQAVDLPNQIRILRVGNNYRVMVGGSLVDDLEDVTIIRTDPGRYYSLQVIAQ
jgi:hypothetical protein